MSFGKDKGDVCNVRAVSGERVFFLRIQNKMGSEQYVPMHWEVLFTSQGIENCREAVVGWFL